MVIVLQEVCLHFVGNLTGILEGSFAVGAEVRTSCCVGSVHSLILSRKWKTSCTQPNTARGVADGQLWACQHG